MALRGHCTGRSGERGLAFETFAGKYAGEWARGGHVCEGARSHRNRWTVPAGLQDFQKANAADPDSAVVWAGLAEAEVATWRATQDKAWRDRAVEAERQSELRTLDTAAGHRAAAMLERESENAEKHFCGPLNWSRGIRRITRCWQTIRKDGAIRPEFAREKSGRAGAEILQESI